MGLSQRQVKGDQTRKKKKEPQTKEKQVVKEYVTGGHGESRTEPTAAKRQGRRWGQSEHRPEVYEGKHQPGSVLVPQHHPS